MYVCYLSIKKPRARKWEHVLTFTDKTIIDALNRVAKIDFDTVMTKGNNFDFLLSVCDNHRVDYTFRNGLIRGIYMI